MHDWRQDADAEFSLDVRRIPLKAAFHRQERIAAEDDRVSQEQSILLAQASNLGLVKSLGKNLTFGRRAFAF